MGREYRLQGDSRLREESDRRPARIPAPVSTEFLNLELESDAAIVGIDVGENFLDLASIAPERRELRYARIALDQICGADSVAALADLLVDRIPELRADAVAIVDSPRCPIDTDCSQSHFAPRENPPARRAIDSGLRAMVNRLNENPARARKTQLWLFPTPPTRYFTECVLHPACKPHLRSMGEQMFRPLESPAQIPARLTGGALFTRFMIAGFAVYQALATIGVHAYEGYPYLGFKLWMARDDELPVKKKTSNAYATALEARRRILHRITLPAKFKMAPPATYDQADAAILATTVAAASRDGSIFQIRDRAEGRFIVALDRTDAAYLRSTRT
jgi:hypothetical protein